MIAVDMVQAACDQIIHMVAVRDGLMSAVRPVLMLRVMPLRSVGALVRIGRADPDGVLVHVVSVVVMKMPVV